ncbi:43009_t:CDS:2, partial [Gigaspora margarita]
MGQGNNFYHNMIVGHYCYYYQKDFQCPKKKQLSRKQREAEYEKTGGIRPICHLCEINYYRCKSDTCQKCCKKARCNDIICLNCTERGINCKWLLFRTEEEYEKCKNVVSFCKAKFERTQQGQLHFHNYIQFNSRATINIVKAIFDDDEGISFPPEQLDEEGSGPFQFGKYRFLSGSSDETVDKINNIVLENYKKQKTIIDNNYSYKD